MASDSTIPAFIINLERDIARRDAMMRQFETLPEFSASVISAMDGRQLSDNACFLLTKSAAWIKNKGTIGCFMSHVKAWEAISKTSASYALVLEDDVRLFKISTMKSIEFPAEAEIVFVNQRMSPNLPVGDPLAVLPIWHGLNHINELRCGAGGDGYLLTPAGAKKLLAACLKDTYFGHVDGRLIRYASSEHDLAKLPNDSWIEKIIREHHHPQLSPKLGLLKGYCLSWPLVKHLQLKSSRQMVDNDGQRKHG